MFLGEHVHGVDYMSIGIYPILLALELLLPLPVIFHVQTQILVIWSLVLCLGSKLPWCRFQGIVPCLNLWPRVWMAAWTIRDLYMLFRIPFSSMWFLWFEYLYLVVSRIWFMMVWSMEQNHLCSCPRKFAQYRLIELYMRFEKYMDWGIQFLEKTSNRLRRITSFYSKPMSCVSEQEEEDYFEEQVHLTDDDNDDANHCLTSHEFTS